MSMTIYEKMKSVPDTAKKPIQAGRLKGFTDINPMWRIKRLTEVFGACGIGWWYEITDKRLQDDPRGGETAAFVDINLYFVDPESGKESKAIPGTGGAMFCAQERNGPHTSDECFKMALTDAISVAAKSLGLGADVYYDKDRDKYTNPQHEEEEPQKPAEVPKPAKTTAPNAAAGASPRPTDGNAERKFRCEICGDSWKPYINKSGEEVSLRMHEAWSKANYRGRVYCPDCIKKMHAKKETA